MAVNQNQQLPHLLDIVVLKSILKKKDELFEQKNLNESYFPRNVDVLSYLYYLKGDKSKRIDLNYTSIVYKIMEIWDRSGIPIITYSGIRKKLANLHKLYITNIKIDIHKQTQKTDKLSENLFFLNSIFNVAKCKCVPNVITTKAVADQFKCKCCIKENLSAHQSTFFVDQLFSRQLKIENWFSVINNVDDNDNSLSSITEKLAEMSISPVQTAVPLESASVDENASLSPDSNDTNYSPYPALEKKLKTSKSIEVNLPESIRQLNFDAVCLDSVRFNTGIRETTSIVNSTLAMVGAITSENQNLVVTPSLIQRKIDKIGSSFAKKNAEENAGKKLLCFFFDGFQAKNLTKRKVGKRWLVEKSTKYENIVIVEQPNDRYLGFIELHGSTAQVIFTGIKDFFVSQNMDLNSLIAIGCDGAATNVGAYNGVIVQLEKYLNLPLHRIVCLLHLLELILHAIIDFYYGHTIGPQKYSSKLSSELENCEKKQIVEFTPIVLGNLPLIGPNANTKLKSSNFKSDQKVLFELSQAVSCGKIGESLARAQLGSLNDVRWTVYANRFLRLYMSTPHPTFALIQVVNFIQKLYVPMLFWIKCYPNWVLGPQHLYRMLLYSRSLQREQFVIIKEKMLNNSFFLHSENVLLSMIADKEKSIRCRAYKIIMSLRERNEENGSARVYTKPTSINFDYEDNLNISEKYTDLIDWSKEIYEPPFTKSLSIDQLNFYMYSDDVIIVPALPLHAQATEFDVQLVKNIVTRYAGHDTQEQRIQTKLIARGINTEFRSSYRKSDYKVYKS